MLFYANLHYLSASLLIALFDGCSSFELVYAGQVACINPILHDKCVDILCFLCIFVIMNLTSEATL